MRHASESVLLLLLLLIVAYCTSQELHNETTDYTGWKVFQLLEFEQDIVNNWMNDLVENGECEALSGRDLLASAELWWKLYRILEVHQTPFEIIIDDLNKMIVEQMAHDTADPNSKVFQLDKYHTYEQINDYLYETQKQYPRKINVINIGKSFEGRDTNVMKIGTGVNKPVFWMDCGIHAREWISPAVCIYLIHKLTGNDAIANKLIRKIDFYILPVANPDGYEFTWTKDRIWRKNRSSYGELCTGVDLNRNFDFYWNRNGTSEKPCASTYAGTQPFSEVEARNMRDALTAVSDRLKMYVSFHAFGQMTLTPWGHTVTEPEDYDDMKSVAERASDAMVTLSDTPYNNYFEVGVSSDMLYAATGTSTDWVKGVLGVKYAYTMELRDMGRYGFFLPSREILKSGEEIWLAVKSYADAILKEEE